MRKRRTAILISCLTAIGLGLLLLDLWLGLRNYRYSRLIEEYECGYLLEQPCRADFDGDGRLTQIEVKRRHDAPVEAPPRFSGIEPEVVLNVFSQDNTSRTHVGVRNESGRARLIIYDATRWPGERTLVNSVYAWNGKSLVEIAPAMTDQEILSAMAARDDAGTLSEWVIYYLLAWPGRFVYASLFVVAALVYRKYRRAERLIPVSA
jgi:hypothetical protein